MPNTVNKGNAFNGDRPLSAGALAFTPEGTLFLGDSKAGAIWAYPLRTGDKVSDVAPFLFADIDRRMADVLGVAPRQLVYNGMAVRPLTREPHISLGIKSESEPIISESEPIIARHQGAIVDKTLCHPRRGVREVRLRSV